MIVACATSGREINPRRLVSLMAVRAFALGAPLDGPGGAPLHSEVREGVHEVPV